MSAVYCAVCCAGSVHLWQRIHEQIRGSLMSRSPAGERHPRRHARRVAFAVRSSFHAYSLTRRLHGMTPASCLCAGVLSGEKQRLERTYDFIDVCGAAHTSLQSSTILCAGLALYQRRSETQPSSSQHWPSARLLVHAGWFAARCDLILLLFDPHKLDISDEFKEARYTLLPLCVRLDVARLCSHPY